MFQDLFNKHLAYPVLTNINEIYMYVLYREHILRMCTISSFSTLGTEGALFKSTFMTGILMHCGMY